MIDKAKLRELGWSDELLTSIQEVSKLIPDLETFQDESIDLDVHQFSSSEIKLDTSHFPSLKIK